MISKKILAISISMMAASAEEMMKEGRKTNVLRGFDCKIAKGKGRPEENSHFPARKGRGGKTKRWS
jgi:hypothetical protein